MSNAENDKVEAQPDGDQDPSSLSHAKGDQNSAQQDEKVSVAHDMMGISAGTRSATQTSPGQVQDDRMTG
jgi:hypothetical protein